MFLTQIAAFCSHLKFKRFADDNWLHFDETGAVCDHNGRPARVTRVMLDANDWEPNCAHPNDSIIVEATTNGTLFQCKECLQEVEPVSFKKKPPKLPDIPKANGFKMGYRELNNEKP